MQDQQQPGWTFQPGGQQPQPSPEPQTPAQGPAPQITPQPQQQVPQQHAMEQDSEHISWTASEYIAHEKSPVWFIKFGVATAIFLIATFAITRSIFTVGVMIVFAIGFMILANRKPAVLNYQLSDGVIRVGQKTYALSDFKSFAIIEEGQIDSISLLPLKRFLPALDIYFAPDDEDAIAEFLSDYLPFEHRTQEMLDKFMHKIRF